ncbi:class I SAM-dependent methyltransferase [Lentibacter algarum]|uniref:class I SAM-dependent methyltransferase n=1 Tax=Lentibacter algarum TaxID=576131 RepID=UPI001C07DF28|nr:class I SAM-dependent methyltransferase [Lentibacter algarum]MBU2981482.1 class I SAM-dependent methyltransferase [Lentibacter algarum]
MVDAATFWDKVAPKYAQSKISDMEAYEYTLERTRSYLKPTDRVLELGCGTGSTALLLAPGVKQVVGTDIAQGMIEIARSKPQEKSNADFRVLGIEDAVALREPFDVVAGFNLFHLVPNPQALFADIYEMLPEGGLFVSKTPCLADKAFGWKRFPIMAALPVMQLLGKAPRPVSMFKIADIDRMILEAGFEIVESGSFPSISRYIVARRS